jgi:hypothetical protein
MIQRKSPRRLWTALALAALTVCVGDIEAQDSLTALLRANAHPMQATADGRLTARAGSCCWPPGATRSSF